MPLYRYRAYDHAGAKLEGQLEAKEQSEAIARLKNQGLFTADIFEVKTANQNSLFANRKITLSDIEFLTAELSLLLASGVRIDKGLDIIAKTKAKPALAQLIAKLSLSLKKGSSLAEAVGEHSNIFEPLYCNLIQLGEASGNLPAVFDELAKDLKFRQDLQRKIISSLTYPIVILLVCVASIFFIFNFIIPQMSSLFTDLEAVPWYTKMMIQTSNWMTEYQGGLFLGGASSIGLGIYAFKQTKVKIWWSETVVKLPVLKGVVALTERIRFCSSIAMMLKSGLRVDNAIALAVGNIKNYVIRREIDIAKKKIKQGDGLTLALSQSVLFPDFFVSLLDIGEQSGNLEKVFDEITNRSRQEFETWTQKVTTLIEPLLILFMGAFVGGVVVIMLMSMISVNDVSF
ncbi:type II secretion system F family protein [Paraglaciecola sp.]|uniref:type II secretion system F family protein n=1 Tax=Paraglaciecola sp. TaxID=1920173 RepID=UPI003EF6C47E